MRFLKLFPAVLALALTAGVNSQTTTCDQESFSTKFLQDLAACSSLSNQNDQFNCLCADPVKSDYDTAYQCAKAIGAVTADAQQQYDQYKEACASGNATALAGIGAGTTNPTGSSIPTGTMMPSMTMSGVTMPPMTTGAPSASMTGAPTSTASSMAPTTTATTNQQGSGAARKLAGSAGAAAIIFAGVAAFL
ncbi:hypothetical protein HDV00_009517 [Rhizophlyctis rosea]|nr:hypothetical protein HDV00_009517 [Rhizophlyctis rosea]